MEHCDREVDAVRRHEKIGTAALQPARTGCLGEEKREEERGRLAGEVTWDGRKQQPSTLSHL